MCSDNNLFLIIGIVLSVIFWSNFLDRPFLLFHILAGISLPSSGLGYYLTTKFVFSQTKRKFLATILVFVGILVFALSRDQGSVIFPIISTALVWIGCCLWMFKP